MQFCPFCGKPLAAAGATFCAYCGRALPMSGGSGATASYQPAGSPGTGGPPPVSAYTAPSGYASAAPGAMVAPGAAPAMVGAPAVGGAPPVTVVITRSPKSKGIAVLLEVLLSGAGAMYADQVGMGMAWLIGTIVVTTGAYAILMAILSTGSSQPADWYVNSYLTGVAIISAIALAWLIFRCVKVSSYVEAYNARLAASLGDASAPGVGAALGVAPRRPFAISVPQVVGVTIVAGALEILVAYFWNPYGIAPITVALAVAFGFGLERLRSAERGRATVEAALWGILAGALCMPISAVRLSGYGYVSFSDALLYIARSNAIPTIVGALAGVGFASGFAPWGRLHAVSRVSYPWRVVASVVGIAVAAGAIAGNFYGDEFARNNYGMAVVGVLLVLAFSVRAYRLSQRLAASLGSAGALGLGAAPQSTQVEPVPNFRWAFLIAGIGGIVALFAYFVLPYASTDVAYSQGSPFDVTTMTVSPGDPVYLVLIAALLVGVLGFVSTVRSRAYAVMTRGVMAFAIIFGSIVGLLTLFIQWAQLSTGYLTGASQGSGFWIIVLGLVVGIVGGALVFLKS